MPEYSEPKIEKEPVKLATDAHLEQLNPQLWQELAALSPEQRDARWLNLTQKHLKDYQAGDSATESFQLEELELMLLHRLGEKDAPTLNPAMPQRGFYFDPAKQPQQRMEKFGNFGNFVMTVQHEAEAHIKDALKPWQILVGGIGISGKATLRKVLAKELSEKLPEKKVISWDRDYQKLFPVPAEWQGNINVIEDVHGLDEERDDQGKLKRFNGAEGLPDGYDLVLYVLPTASTYRQSLLNRGRGWLKAGKLDLTAPGEKQYADDQEQKIKQTADELERILLEAKKWFSEQLRVLRELKNSGVKIAVVEPSEIFQELYNFKDKPEIDKSFFEELETLLKE